MKIEFGEWLPDLPALSNPGALEAKNVLPSERGYRPLRSLSEYSAAIGARCIGFFVVRSNAGVASVFAGTATKLYRLTGATTSWTDVTRSSGGDYAADQAWRFNQFGDYITAWNGVDAPQVFQLGVSTEFAALSGSPPLARYACNAREQVMVGNIASNPNRVQWCGVDSLTTWGTNIPLQADYQDLQGDGGNITALVGRFSPHIWCEKSIWVATYAGPPVFWQFDRVESERGSLVPGSVVGYGNLSFGLCADGFYVFDGMSAKPIGQGKVNRWFYARFDEAFRDRMQSAIDPVGQSIVWAFPGTGHANGDPNFLLFFHWPTGRWSYAEMNIEYLAAGGTSFGYTLEDLDSISASIDDLPFSLDSRVWTSEGSPILSAFTTDHKLAFFNGDTMAATVDTGEAQLFPGKRAYVQKVWPLVDGRSVTPTITPITRNLQHEAVTEGTPVSLNSVGYAPMRSNARYQRARLKTVAGDDWDHLVGLDIEAVPTGGR